MDVQWILTNVMYWHTSVMLQSPMSCDLDQLCQAMQYDITCLHTDI